MARRSRRFVCSFALLLAAASGCDDKNLANGTGGSGGMVKGDGTGTFTNCVSDPDKPEACTFWTCTNVPTDLGNKLVCTSDNPPQSPHGPGGYTCAAGDASLYCPANGSDRPYDCMATEFDLTCTTTGPGGSTGGWDCKTNPDGTQICRNGMCTEFCTPPGATPPNGWTCVPDTTSGTICYSTPPGTPPGSTCPQVGVKRWCDAPYRCAWGQQTCELHDGAYRWGTCVEGSRTGPHPAPNTECSCWSPFYFSPNCCENAQCTVVGERQVPCSTSGAQCQPCGANGACGSGLECFTLAKRTANPSYQGDPTQPQFVFNVEQFCTKPCAQASDCPSGYMCMRASDTGANGCVPVSQTCR